MTGCVCVFLMMCWCTVFIVTALLSLHSLTLLIGCIPVVAQPHAPLSDIPACQTKSHLHHPSVVLPHCQSTLNGFSLDLSSTKTRQCPVEHTDIPGGAMAAQSGGQGDPLVIYYFHSTENNCLKQTESLWTIGRVYLTNFAWVLTIVDTHPDGEARHASCFAFIGTPTILILKAVCPNACPAK